MSIFYINEVKDVDEFSFRSDPSITKSLRFPMNVHFSFLYVQYKHLQGKGRGLMGIADSKSALEVCNATFC